MSDPLLGSEDDEAATPLTPAERDGLIPAYVTLRRELNALEQSGVADADRWAFARKRQVLDEGFLLRLHKRMFGKVWRWAGKPRTSERNIGVTPWRIAPDLRAMLDDVGYWIDHAVFGPDEIAVRFHHRLVFIHPFANGNGRLSRLAADLLAIQLGRPRFTWGGETLTAPAETRRLYVTALKAADGGDIAPLLAFARS